jgi:hypothetical protein
MDVIVASLESHHFDPALFQHSTLITDHYVFTAGRRCSIPIVYEQDFHGGLLFIIAGQGRNPS